MGLESCCLQWTELPLAGLGALGAASAGTRRCVWGWERELAGSGEERQDAAPLVLTSPCDCQKHLAQLAKALLGVGVRVIWESGCKVDCCVRSWAVTHPAWA